jgi:glycosyltransferase involved in cell wall biosynthesis
MKIALLVPGGVDRSGTVKVIPCLLWLIERLTAAGHDVHVFASRHEDRPGSWPLLGATVRNAGRRPTAAWTFRLIAAEHRMGPFDVIHAFWSELGAIGAVASKLFRVPLVLTLPGGDVVRLPDIGYGSQLSRLGRLKFSIAARAARQINTPSRFMRSLAAKLGVDAVVVPLGVDLARWPPASPRPRDVSVPVRLLHVASLNRVKDQATLLEAIAVLRGRGVALELKIAGFDTLDGEIQRMADRMGLTDAVDFLGELTHAELRPWFDWADILVMTSRHEAGPLVTLEAAVAGIPTVGTCVGHIADLSPGAALSVPVGDARALGDAIGELATDERRRLDMAAAAQAFAIRHDADFTARTFLETYGRIRGATGPTAKRPGDEPKRRSGATTTRTVRVAEG